jgi:ElaB/YqjD/DUF883 family membrane-anchored ribosome-binding protein
MNETVERFKEQAAHMQSAYEGGRKALGDLTHVASDRSRQFLHDTDEWAHQNPWMMVGIVAGAAVVLGLVMAQLVRHD